MASYTLENVQSRSHRRPSIDQIRSRASMELEQPLLPPVDQGRGAWLTLASCCLIQLPVWGFSLVSGLFQEYFKTHDELEGGTGGLAIVRTTSTGILYLLSPISFTLLTRYPHMQRYCAPVGLVLSVGGSLLSSFAHTVWQLIATQGILCGLGNGLVFSPTTLLLDQWFIRRKGLAYGIMWAGKSVCGVALPFLTSAALDRYGARTTLRAWTVITLFTTSIALPFIKPRVPPAVSTSPQPLNLAFLKLLTFWTLELGNIIQSLGYFLPSTYLPSYSTTAAGLSETTGTFLLALFNATSIVGGIVLGSMCDRFAVSNIMLLSSMGSGLSVLLFWGLSATATNHLSSSSEHLQAPTALALLTVFSITYGFFAGGFSSTWSGVLAKIKREMPSLETGLVFGLLAGGRGIGSVISGPLSEKLMQRGPVASVHGGVSTGYATDYGAVILFTGVTALLGGWSWFWSWMRKLGSDMQS
ncbi:putative MFS monocarboxylate transporter [Aspergillus brunneoviolaceus CBS 621.78]|uniref:MFS general substrate transporter n=1 Tax=Aspergillus brunneoviolaceus CBS 621.78 TaxID=1450534 RepID=A0ACD1GCG0_9EURO|nr:MFS general substrate transporter [Aspergillus brunneoviolaceus CBS 621.78]RAH46867.1 MFS general substrate transporter [Aspergillus brunneoviolaceus CBS 621.78]